MSKYVYTQRDNIADPQTYMYSKTKLFDYATSRRRFRDACLARLSQTELDKEGQAVVALIKPVLPASYRNVWPDVEFFVPNGTLLSEAEGRLRAETALETWETYRVLKDLLLLEIGQHYSELANSLWILFQRRFEVKKRVWTHYAPKLKPASRDFKQLLLYAMFGAGLGLRAKATGDIRTLNGLLKVNDTLISVTSYPALPITWVWALLALECEREVFLMLQQRVLS